MSVIANMTLAFRNGKQAGHETTYRAIPSDFLLALFYHGCAAEAKRYRKAEAEWYLKIDAELFRIRCLT